MYNLMYANIPVLQLDIKEKTVKVLHPSMLPISFDKENVNYDDFSMFCSNRVLMANRKFFKEILTSCRIDDQSDVNICILSHALSFRDNYWIKEENSPLKWDNINLYENPFSEDIAITALTGEVKNIHIGDDIFTGELTALGTRSKCFIRDKEQIFIAKNETKEEIASEVLCSYICDFFNIKNAKYINLNIYGKDCSVCKLNTSKNTELIPARDILTFFNVQMNSENQFYETFLKFARKDFIKMQLFDYIILNTDRNRDNFGLLKEKGKIIGLYPLFDHDSAFKGKSINAHYFVTNKTFKDSLPIILEKCDKTWLSVIEKDLDDLKTNLLKEKQFFLKLKDENTFEGVFERIENVQRQLAFSKDKNKEDFER